METQDTSGFYRQDPESGELIHAPNFVYARDYELHRDQKDTYTYPIDGWYWFDSEEHAKAFFGITPTFPSQSDEELDQLIINYLEGDL